jgi:hypothetical protein
MARTLLLRLLFCLVAAVPGVGQDAAQRDTFLQAKNLWSNQGDRDGAAAKFELVIAALEPKAKELPQEWRQVLCEAYNWLAVLDDRSTANKARATRNLEAALDLDPDFDIDRGITPSRLQALFDSLRSSKLVKVQLSYQPDGGSLLLDGKPTAVLPMKYLPLGAHQLVYRKPGFSSVEKTLQATSGATAALDFSLVRTSSTVKLYLSPPGTEVSLDGKRLGKATGIAGADAAPLAEEAGIKLESLSAPFVVSDLAPGEHVLEFSAPCYRTRKILLPKEHTQPFQDVTLKPYLLESAKGSLAVTSLWDGGEVFIDGERRGALPMPPLSLCAGKYALEVKFPSGGFTRSVEIEDKKTVAVEVKPKPRLAFVGIDGDEDFPGRAKLQAQLLALGDRLQTVAFLPRTGPGTLQEHFARMKAAKDSELFLRVELRKDGAAHLVDLVVSTPENEEDHIQVKTLEADPLGALVARLNRQPVLQVAWAGLSLLDLPGKPGPWVLQAEEKALQAGIQLHQPVLQVDGKPVATVAEFRNALQQAAGDRVKISQAGGTFSLPLIQAPVELPVSDPAYCYPYLLAELRLRLLGAKGEAAAQLRFQQALALLHFRKYERAVELLRDIRTAGPAGVGQGTVEYYSGLCLLRLGTAYVPEAIQALTQALRYPAATLFGPEGPLVAPLAKQAIEDNKLN